MNNIMPKKRSVGTVCALIALAVILVFMARASVYATANPIKISVEQVFSTNSVYAEDVFTYVLRTYDKEAPLPTGSSSGGYTFSITGNKAFDINTLAFEKAGVYHYEIYQSISVVKPGYTYDRRIYAIEATVDSTLSAILIVRINDKKTDKIVFENSFNVAPTDPGLMVDPPVYKTVSGDPARDASFKFTLTASSLSNPMPSGSSGGSKSIWITGPGRGEFGTWSYNRAGIYYYTVREEHLGDRGYTYDSTVYTITDRVTEEYGRLVLSRIVTNNMNKPVSAYEFHNSYSPTGGILGGGNVDRENPSRNIDDDGNPRGSAPDVENPFANLTDDGNPGGNPGGGPAAEPTVGSPAVAKPGVFGPKTGDNTNALLYIILLAAGGALATGALIYLLVCGRDKKINRLTLKNEKG